MDREDRLSSYLEHLPAVLQEGPFIGRFLLAFEAILHGLPPQPEVQQLPVGHSDLLDRMHTYFDPLGEPNVANSRMPAEFLPWLAQWMATTLWDDWSEETKRNFLANCISLYRRRGTRSGLEQLLRICVTPTIEVIEMDPPAPPHYFQVNLTIYENNPTLLARQSRLVQAMVDREKPVHTFYGLSIRYPAMRINNDPQGNPSFGMGILLNRNSVLGTARPPNT